jgi:hypothetical protein
MSSRGCGDNDLAVSMRVVSMSTIYLKAAGFVERLCADGRDVTITDADVADRLRRGGAVETPTAADHGGEAYL